MLSYKEPKQVFGDCRELLDSAAHIRSANMKTSGKLIDLSAKIEAAKQVASCTYEFNTSWGKEVTFNSHPSTVVFVVVIIINHS